MKLKFIVVMAMAVVLSACGNNNAPQMPVETPQQVVQQADSFDTGDAAVGALAGGVAGYMMGKGSNNSQPRTIIVDRRPTNYGYNDYNRGRKVVTTTTTTVKKSMFGNKRTTTRATTSRRR